MDNKDIYRYARELIDQYDANAPTLAATRIDAMLECGDLDGVIVWKRLRQAVEELQAVHRVQPPRAAFTIGVT